MLRFDCPMTLSSEWQTMHSRAFAKLYAAEYLNRLADPDLKHNHMHKPG